MQVHKSQVYSDCYRQSIAFASIAPATLQNMNPDNQIEWRKTRLKALASKFGGNASLGRVLGYRDGAYIGQMIGGHRPITEKTIVAAEELPGCDGWFESNKNTQPATIQHLEHAGLQRPVRPVVVVGQAKLGENGYYEEISSVAGSGDGTVAAFSSDPEAYALRVKGDSMFPAIRDGWYVVVEPNGPTVIGEFVLIKLANGQKMVKELLMQTEHGITVMSVNGNVRRTIAFEEIDNHHGLQPVASIMSPSKWSPV